jgi:glycosyltransferase involved in cell wall biosynthesis
MSEMSKMSKMSEMSRMNPQIFKPLDCVDISVIMPVYVGFRNMERLGYFFEAIESYCVQQTSREFELLVVDDGSSINLLGELQKRFQIENFPFQFRYFRNEIRKEKSSSCNLALSVARGNYIAFGDSDDRALPIKLESLARALDENPSKDLVFGGIYLIDDRGNRTQDHRESKYWSWYLEEPVRLGFSGKLTYENLCKVNFIHKQAVMVRRSGILRTSGFNPDLIYGEDYRLWLDVLKTARDKDPLVVIKDSGEVLKVAEYRKHSDSMGSPV